MEPFKTIDYRAPHWILDGNGNIIRNSEHVETLNHKKLPNFGTSVSPGTAKTIIQNLVDSQIIVAGRNSKNEVKLVIENKPISFVFGRNGLNEILKLDKCGGIRFYLALKDSKEFGEEKGSPQLTLVAIGVKEDNNHKDGDEPDLGFSNGHLIDFETEKEQEKFRRLNEKQKQDDPSHLLYAHIVEEETLIVETVPTWP